MTDNTLAILKEQKLMRMKGGLYHKVQIDLTYNSNHIEGSKLTHEQTRYIFETNTIGVEKDTTINVDDIIETANHFRCIDFIIDYATEPLNEEMIKTLHNLLKSGTADSRKDWFATGDYKRVPNEVVGIETSAPEKVQEDMVALLNEYHASVSSHKGDRNKLFDDLLDFHTRFETIHPFQDGNGRVGRLILFKECLANNITPFIITEEHRWFYYRGLHNWPATPGYLRDTCLTAQDNFKRILDYFRIEHED